MRPLPLLLACAGLLPAADPAPAGGPSAGGVVAEVYPYEPTYVALDPGISDAVLNAKLQFSFAFRLIGRDPAAGPLRPDGLYVAYSQTSFWDLGAKSRPFFDSSYRPEAWWHLDLPTAGVADHLAIEPGLGHESNGRDDVDSRSLNHAFLRVLASWEQDGLVFTAAPRMRTYLEKEDNPDLPRYRGYADLVGGVEQRGSWGATASGRIGSGWDRGSLMVEVTHPLADWTAQTVRGYLYLQGFTGWSETLRRYDEKSPQPRVLVGFAITR